MRAARGACALAAALCFCSAAYAATAGEPAADVAARARRVLSDERFQTEHPPPREPGAERVRIDVGGNDDEEQAASGGPQEQPGAQRGSRGGEAGAELGGGPGGARRRRDVSRARAPRQAATARPPPPPPDTDTASFVGTLFTGLLVAAVAAVIALVLAGVLGRRRPPAAPAPGSAAGEDRAGRRLPPLGAIEALAAEGRHAEAIHAMLLLSVGRLAQQGRLALSDDMTGREALRALAAGDAGRAALGELVLAVELSLFGGRDPGRDDYERCASALRELLATPAPGAQDVGEAA